MSVNDEINGGKHCKKEKNLVILAQLNCASQFLL